MKKKHYWFAVCILLVIIFMLMVTGRPLLVWIKSLTSFSNFIVLSITLIVLSVISLLGIIYKNGYLRKSSSVRMIALLFVAYGFLALQVEQPEEILHYAEYGLLFYFLLRAIGDSIPGIWSWILALLLSSGIGVGEECLQALVPNRFSQPKDMMMNVLACVLGLIFTSIVLREHTEKDAE